MAQPRRGRPPNPVDPEASDGARLGAEVRARRSAAGLTLQALGDLAGGYTPQYVSEVERAKTAATPAFVTAVDLALDAAGTIEILLPAAMREHERKRRERAAARRAARQSALRCDPPAHSDLAGDADVEPTDRRGLLGAAGAAAIGLSTAAAPTAARAVDPELPAHWDRLLGILGRHDERHGPREALSTVLGELHIITAYREVARGELRTQIMRVEAAWTELAAWLSNDAGDWRTRDSCTNRALQLAEESDNADVIGLARMRQSQWAIQDYNASQAVRFARAALAVRGTSEQTRGRCLLRAAHGHALAGHANACERSLNTAFEQADAMASAAGSVTPIDVRANEARCWMWMQPRKAIGLYENALREWPRDRMRDGGLHQARLALACANVGELDRARAEGAKAFAIAKRTGSAVAHAELRRLGAALRAI